MELKVAERKKAKLKIALSAPSGGGKTKSSLLLAKGLVGDWSKIVIIDTENGSGELYSDMGPYRYLELKPPFTPENYIKAIKVAENNGMEAIIVDSLSHEWEGSGGALELQGQLGGRYQDWAKVTPRHRAFIDAMLQSPCHVIGTMRRKTDYEMTKDGNKTVVTKVGLKEVQRDGMEYEFTLHFALEQNHLAKAEKDRTGLFDKRPEFIITEETGKELRAWADSGADIVPEPKKRVVFDGENPDEVAGLSDWLLANKKEIKADKYSAIIKKLHNRPKKDIDSVIAEVMA